MPLVQNVSQIPLTLGEAGRNLFPEARANVKCGTIEPRRHLAE